MPKCYWSGFQHGGTCTSTCPQDAVEIGSDDSYCENGGYAAACCDPSEGNSVSLYHTCTWSGDLLENGDGLIACGLGEESEGDSCPDSLSPVARSRSGSGAVQCEVLDVSPATHRVTYSVRSYCCDTSDRNLKWGSCSKEGTDGHTEDDPGHCPGDCPEDRYRVALDQHAPECSSGAAATCCVPMASTLDTNLEEEVRSQAEALDLFLHEAEEYCSNDTAKLLAESADADESTTGKFARALRVLMTIQILIFVVQNQKDHSRDVRPPWITQTRSVRSNNCSPTCSTVERLTSRLTPGTPA